MPYETVDSSRTEGVIRDSRLKVVRKSTEGQIIVVPNEQLGGPSLTERVSNEKFIVLVP